MVICIPLEDELSAATKIKIINNNYSPYKFDFFRAEIQLPLLRGGLLESYTRSSYNNLFLGCGVMQ